MPDFTPTPQVEPEELPGRAFPRLPDELPNGTQQLGADIQGAGAILSQHAQAAEAMAQRTQFAQGDNAIQQVALTLTHDPQNGAFTKEGQSAFNLGQQYLPAFDAAVKPIIDSTPDPNVRQQLQLAAAQHRTSLMSQLDAHEIDQHKQLALSTANASVSLAQQAAAANYNNPDVIASNLAKVDGALSMRADNEGWSPEMFQQAQHDAHVRLYGGVLSAMIGDSQLPMAQHFLDSVKGELTPQELESANSAMTAGKVKASADSIMGAYRLGTTTGATAMQALASSDLAPDDQAKVTQEVERQREALMYARRQNPATMQQITAIEESLAKGQPLLGALPQVDALWQRGAISDEQHISMRSAIDRAGVQQQQDAQNLAFAQQAYASKTPLDPKDKDASAAIDSLFTGLTRATTPGSAEYTNRATDIAARTGIVPASAVSWARSNLVSGDPQTAAQAANLIAQLQESNPRAADYVDEKTKAMADSISTAVRAGTNPQVAVTQAQQNATLSTAQQTALKLLWDSNNHATQKGQADALKEYLQVNPGFKTGMFSSLPDIPPQMQGQFDQATRRYFDLTGGNLMQARQLASRDLLRTWGVTQVNGHPQIMQYAPERMFPGLTAAMVRADLSQQLSEHPNALQRMNPDTGQMEPANAAPDSVRLIPTDVTARTRGVTWQLGVPDQFGALDIVRKADGSPLLYNMPTSSAAVEAMRQQAAATGIAKARQLQKERAAADAALEQYQRGGTAVPLL